MPLLVIKLMENDSPVDLVTAMDAYLVAQSADGVRGMSSDHFLDHDGDVKGAVAIAHNGIDTPSTLTGKIASLAVDKDQVVKAQTAVDLALSLAEHETVTDADLDNVANEITSASTPFTVAEDVGRKVLIQGILRTLTAITSTSVAIYDGVALTGTSQTVVILGAESLQAGSLSLSVHKAKDRDTVFSVRAILEGETL